MKRGLSGLKTAPRKKKKFSLANFVRISGLTTLANSIVCDQCDELVRGEQMFADEKNAIDLCKSCFERKKQEFIRIAPAFEHVENIPEGKMRNGYYRCAKGDTISKIAQKVKVKVQKILSMNIHIPDLTGRMRLKAGTVLKVAEVKLKILTVKLDDIEKISAAVDEEDSVERHTKMNKVAKAKRTARLRAILKDLCSEKYHQVKKINKYYEELKYCCKDTDRAVKIWVLRAKIREELGDVTSYLKSFQGGKKYNVYWDAAVKGEKLWYTCFLINLNFFNGNAELMWEKEDDIIEYNLNHLWLKAVPEGDEEHQPVCDGG